MRIPTEKPFSLPSQYILPLVMTGVIALSLSACGQPGAGGPMGGGVPVDTETVTETSVIESQVYQGNLISRHSVILKPQVDGQISAIYVKAGDHVKAGQPLMLVDPRKQQAALKSSQADSAALRANIQQTQDNLQNVIAQRPALEASVQLNQTLFDRYTKLYAKGAASKQDVDQYTNQLARSKADLESNTAQIAAQRSSVTTAKKTYERSLAGVREQSVQLQYFKITAPFNGVVGDVPVKLGNYVDSDTELVSVTENNPLELNVSLPGERSFEIKKGLQVDILDNKQKPVASSKVFFVSPLIDPSTQTILVKAMLNNPKEILKANQSVKTKVTFAETSGVLVPPGAITDVGGQDFVFLVQKTEKGHVAKQIPIKRGQLQNNRYVVTQGLKAGDVIISQGIQKLFDGAPITPLPQKGQSMQPAAAPNVAPEADKAETVPATEKKAAPAAAKTAPAKKASAPTPADEDLDPAAPVNAPVKKSRGQEG